MHWIQQIADCEQLVGSLRHLGVGPLSRTQLDVWLMQWQSCVTCGSRLTGAADTRALRAGLDSDATLCPGILFSHPKQTFLASEFPAETLFGDTTEKNW